MLRLPPGEESLFEGIFKSNCRASTGILFALATITVRRLHHLMTMRSLMVRRMYVLPLKPLRDVLDLHPALARVTREYRPFQVTLKAPHLVSEHNLWELVNEIILQIEIDDVKIVRSGHSIDILAPEVTKLNVVRRLRETVGNAPILTIGDRGRWPGNDHELLNEPFALSVDEVSTNLSTCWNMGQQGQRGPAVTLDYLSALDVEDGCLRFAEKALR